MTRRVSKTAGTQWRWFLWLYLAGTGLLLLASWGLKSLLG